jgi:hypothetical protein
MHAMTNHRIPSALVFLALALLGNEATAQCRSFARNSCIPELAPYKFNETFNAAQLAPGEEAEVNLTFYSGQDYRVMVCADKVLDAVNWKLMDGSNKIIFESFADDPKKTFDLRVENTQQMKVHVWVPEKNTGTGMVPYGCVVILVGFKEQ